MQAAELIASSDDYDSPWKDLLDEMFEPFMEFFFPRVHIAIDWTRGFEFLDKELQKITADAPIGRRYVDKLIKVWHKGGQETWILIHIEVQVGREDELPFRLYVYHYRLFDRYKVPIATFVVLADNDLNWRPTEYRQAVFGTETSLRFSHVKLLDYANKIDITTAQAGNPFEVVVIAHLKAQETRRDALARYEWKWQVTRALYERGYHRERIIQVFRFIDWVMRLPERLAEEFDNRLAAYEEIKHMPYVTHIERRGIQIGEERGVRIGEERGKIIAKQEMCLRFAKHKFGSVTDQIEDQINTLSLVDLDLLIDALFDMTSLETLTTWLERTINLTE